MFAESTKGGGGAVLSLFNRYGKGEIRMKMVKFLFGVYRCILFVLPFCLWKVITEIIFAGGSNPFTFRQNTMFYIICFSFFGFIFLIEYFAIKHFKHSAIVCSLVPAIAILVLENWEWAFSRTEASMGFIMLNLPLSLSLLVYPLGFWWLSKIEISQVNDIKTHNGKPILGQSKEF